MMIDDRLDTLERRLARAESRVPLMCPGFVPLRTPLTSTSWDGDAKSTTAKTVIDMSAVFGVPAGIKAVLLRTWVRDSGSAAATDCFLGFAPNDTANQLADAASCAGLPNDVYTTSSGIVPCDANGDIYYQIVASGAGTLDANIQVWGYWL